VKKRSEPQPIILLGYPHFAFDPCVMPSDNSLITMHDPTLYIKCTDNPYYVKHVFIDYDSIVNVVSYGVIINMHSINYTFRLL